MSVVLSRTMCRRGHRTPRNGANLIDTDNRFVTADLFLTEELRDRLAEDVRSFTPERIVTDRNRSDRFETGGHFD